MEQVIVTPACWLWEGAINEHGYGVIKVGGRDGRTFLVHRFLDALRNGPIPHGLNVNHHCDQPRCVRGDHLWRGTQAENIADMDAKGRGRRHFTSEQMREVWERRRRGELPMPRGMNPYTSARSRTGRED